MKVHVNALTQPFNGVSKQLLSQAGVSKPWQPGGTNQIPAPGLIVFNAIWDTGATGSVISSAVVKQLGLLPTGMTNVHTAGGVVPQNTYLINLELPMGVAFPFLQVTEAPLGGCEVLIGMDVISQGDLAITNFQGKTTLSFRVPSVQKIDFVQQIQAAQGTNNINRSAQKQKRKQAAKQRKKK